MYQALIPVIQNTIHTFITNTLREFSEKDNYEVNLLFNFTEKEARELIKEVFKNLANERTSYIPFIKEFNKRIDNPFHDDYKTIEVNDYKLFFELLNTLYEKELSNYEKYKEAPYPYNRMERFFKDIFLRCDNLNYNNINDFLREQIKIYDDDTFFDFKEEKTLGTVINNDNIEVTAINKLADTWDESPFEMIFRYKYKEDGKPNKKGKYELPRIRYGIYEKDGKKVCKILSIQKVSDEFTENKELSKKLDRMRFKIGSLEEDVEPNKVIALSLFFDLLKQKGINEIEVPMMYILDYDYHIKRSKYLLNTLERTFTMSYIETNTEGYREFKEYYNNNYEQEEKISKLKTTNLILTVLNCAKRYNGTEIKDLDNKISITLGDTIQNSSFLEHLQNEINNKCKRRKI